MKIDFGLFCVHGIVYNHCIPLHIAYESIASVNSIGLIYGNRQYLCAKEAFYEYIHVYT